MSDKYIVEKKCKECGEHPYCAVLRIPKEKIIEDLMKKCPCLDCIIKVMCSHGCDQWHSEIYAVAVDFEIHIPEVKKEL